METTQVEQVPDFTIFPSAAQIMHSFLEGELDNCGCHYSSEGIFYHPDGRVKLVRDSEVLRKIGEKRLRFDGGLVLPYEVWELIDGKVLSEGESVKYGGAKQLMHRTDENPFWQWLAGGDKCLLSDFATMMKDRVSKRAEACYHINVSVWEGYRESMRINIIDLLWSKNPMPLLHFWHFRGVSNTYGKDGGGAYGAAFPDIKGYRLLLEIMEMGGFGRAHRCAKRKESGDSDGGLAGRISAREETVGEIGGNHKLYEGRGKVYGEANSVLREAAGAEGVAIRNGQIMYQCVIHGETVVEGEIRFPYRDALSSLLEIVNIPKRELDMRLLEVIATGPHS